ncbi:MAG: hypothetical protein J6V42_06110 [Clostridia bacterium]|nr:hypothetical protein [Clostridia bacterium]
MAENKGNYRHGMYGTPTYKSWSEMKLRCNNPHHSKTDCYVGVTYCEEWEKFENFFKDMGVRPAGTTLDRIDPRGNYEPSNCRWADIITQENNRRNNRKFEYNGESLTLAQIARKYGISRSNLANKIYLKKMDITEAVDYLRGVKTYR